MPHVTIPAMDLSVIGRDGQAFTPAPIQAETVTVALDWDSGPYSTFHVASGAPSRGAQTVTVPKDLWDRYEAASALASDLERQIEECPIDAGT